MNVLILNGTMRPGQNTDALLEPVARTLRAGGAQVEIIHVARKNIAPCGGCYACQRVLDSYGCVQRDDMQGIVDRLVAADAFLLATPIYTWYCTAPMKALLDRHYGLNKYYGAQTGPGLWENKLCGTVVTCGYDRDYGAGPWELGLRRLCEHSHLRYMGMLCERDLDDRASFETPQAVARAEAYARHVLARLRGEEAGEFAEMGE